jgi:hypothetical protein
MAVHLLPNPVFAFNPLIYSVFLHSRYFSNSLLQRNPGIQAVFPVSTGAYCFSDAVVSFCFYCYFCIGVKRELLLEMCNMATAKKKTTVKRGTAARKKPAAKKAAVRKAPAKKKAAAKTRRKAAPQSKSWMDKLNDIGDQISQMVDSVSDSVVLNAKGLAAREKLLEKKAELAAKAEVDRVKHLANEAERWMKVRTSADRKKLAALEKKLTKQLKDAERKVKARAKALEKKAEAKARSAAKKVQAQAKKAKAKVAAPRKKAAAKKKAAPKKKAAAKKRAAPKKKAASKSRARKK